MALGSKTLLLAGTGVVVLAGGALIAYGALAPAAMRRAATDWLAANPDVHVSKLDTDAWGRSIEFDGVSRQQGDTSFSADRVVVSCPLSQLSAAVTGGWRHFAADIAVSNFTGSAGIFGLQAAQITIAGGSYDGPTGAVQDPADLIAGMSAGQISFSNLSTHYNMGGMNAVAHMAGLQAGDVVHGKVGTLAAADVQITADGKLATGVPNQGNAALHEIISFGQMVQTNTDLAAYVRFLRDSGSPDAPLARITDGGSGSDFSMTISGATNIKATIAQITIGPFDARPMKISYRDGIQQMTAHPTQYATWMGDMMQAVHYSSFDMDGLAFSGSTPDQKTYSAGLQHIGVKEFGNGKLGDMQFDAMAIDAGGGHFSMDKFDLADMDLTPLINAMQRFAAGPGGLAGDSAVDRLLNMEPTIGHFELDGVAMKMPDGSTPFSLGDFKTDSSDFVGGLPSHSSMKMDDLIFSLPARNQAAAVMIGMGYGKLDVSSALRMDWDQDSGDMAVTDSSITLKDAAKIVLNARLHRITREELLGRDFAGARFSNVDLKLVDLGFTNRALDYMGSQTGKDRAATIATITAAANISLGALGNSGLAQSLEDAIQKFLQSPQNMELSATPPQPVGVADWKSADWSVKADQ